MNAPIQFSVGDPDTIADNGSIYTDAILKGKDVIICVDGKSIAQSFITGRLSCTFDKQTGKITFNATLLHGRLIQIFY